MGGEKMKITADTNVLVRAMVKDDPEQRKLAQNELSKAELIAVTLPALCEVVWVLSQGYKIPTADISKTLRRLINSANVVIDRPAVEAGLDVLDAGGDFADGIIAYEGRAIGAQVFVSFDKKAVKLLANQGIETRLLF